MKTRVFKIVALAVICIAALGFVVPIIDRLRPSALYIHIDSIPWSSITVKSENLAQPQHFDRSAHALRVSPISHGIYCIGIQLSDGQFIWSQFFHYDAGVRRRIDVFVTPSKRSGYIQFRETANQRERLFEGDIRPEKTTEEKPFGLDWI